MSERVLPSGPLRGRVRVPGSKSLTNRALVAASLAAGESVLEFPLVCDDTVVLAGCLERLGVRVDRGPERWAVAGPLSPRTEEEIRLDVGPAGTPARFLTALVAALPGTYVVDGTARMRERPMGPLVDALRALGAGIAYLGAEGRLPLRIQGRRLRGGRVRIQAGVSSQFVSALMLTAPLLEKGLEVELDGPAVSGAYVELTRKVLDRFVEGGRVPRPAVYRVPGDDSAACFLIAGAAISRGKVELEGLEPGSAQADAVFRTWALAAGARLGWSEESAGPVLTVEGHGPVRPIEADVDDAPDAALPLAALLAFAAGRSRLTGVARLRDKESDRLEAAVDLLSSAGAACGVEAGPRPVLRIDGDRGTPRRASFDAHADHRVAMSAAVLALALPATSTLRGSEAIAKSYPGFFEDWARLTARSDGSP